MLFSKLYSVYSRSIFHINALFYWANISHTNFKQDTEQRLNPSLSKKPQTVKNDQLGQFSVTLT
jgi:hypothetical protein